MSASPSPSPYYLPIRPDWLDRRKEAILEPALPIVDPHHRLWDRPDDRYLLDELLADTSSGHNILATVFVQARAMMRGRDHALPDDVQALAEPVLAHRLVLAPESARTRARDVIPIGTRISSTMAGRRCAIF